MQRSRKLISGLSSILLLVNVITFQVIFFNDVEATNIYALNETFDTYDTGTSAWGGGLIWPGDNTWQNTGTSQRIVEDPSSEDKSIKISITSSAASGAQTRMRTTVDTVNNNTMVLESKFKINDTNLAATGSLYFYRISLLHSNTKTSVLLNIPGNSTATGARMIQAGNDANVYANIMAYSLNQWYNVKFIINATTRTYDVYIAAEGSALEKKATGLALDSKATADYTTGNFTAAQISSYKYAAGGETGEFYVSDVKLFGIDAPAPSITSTSHSNGERGIDPNSNVSVQFNTAMDASTLTTSNIVVKDLSGNAMPYTPIIGVDNSYTIDFNSALSQGGTYTISFTNVKDMYGQALNASPITFYTSGGPNYLINESFNGYATNSTLPGYAGRLTSPVWPNNNTYATNATAKIVEEPSAIDKSINFSFPSNIAVGSEVRLSKDLPLIDSDIVILSTKIKINETDGSDNLNRVLFQMMLGHSNAGTARKLIIYIPGTSAGSVRMIQAYGNGTSLVDIVPYELNKWYDIKVVINKATEKYDVYVAEAGKAFVKGNESPISLADSNTIDYTNGHFNLLFNQAYKNSTNAGNVNFWLDDMKFYAPDGLEIINPALVDSSLNPVDALSPSSEIYGKTFVVNNTQLTQPVTIIVALYDINNKLIDISYQEKSLGANENDELSSTLTLPNNTQDSFVKVFLWNGINNLKPLSNAIRVPAQ